MMAILNLLKMGGGNNTPAITIRGRIETTVTIRGRIE